MVTEGMQVKLLQVFGRLIAHGGVLEGPLRGL